MTVAATELHVRRDAIADISSAAVTMTPGDGEAIFRIDSFALTANNATYAAHGEDMAYWRFYPAPEGFGIVPVWGFATCVASRAEGIAEGARVYGYWPMASHARLRPVRVSPRGFTDGAAHRQGLAAVYNSYVAADIAEGFGDERAYSLFRPLYMTSFLLDDRIAEIEGLTTAVLSSASSKTALGLAHALKRRGGVRVIGLTSAANAAFTRGTGLYDEVVAYDGPLAASGPTAFVDFAGNGAVRAHSAAALGDALTAIVIVGDTHWDAHPGAPPSSGPRPEFFFAPDRVAKRTADWGAAGLQARVEDAWQAFLGSAATWLRYDEAAGAEATMAAWHDIVAGKADPAVGVIRTV
jgi:hypothetical protein